MSKGLRRGAAVALLALMLGLGARPVSAVEVGATAPDVAFGSGAAPDRLSGLLGRVVYLDFWASWCAPCRKSFPWMNDLQARFGEQGLVVVAMGLDRERGDADRFLARNPAQFRIGFDPVGYSAQLYGVSAMPSGVVVGRDGRVALVQRGFRESDIPAVDAAIMAALAAH